MLKDHFGGVVHDTLTDRLYTLNWGARNALNMATECHFARWLLQTPLKVVRNPSFFVDYQDCKFLGHPVYYQESRRHAVLWNSNIRQ